MGKREKKKESKDSEVKIDDEDMDDEIELKSWEKGDFECE